VERLAPKTLDRIGHRHGDRASDQAGCDQASALGGNALHRSAPLGGRYGAEILVSQDRGTHLEPAFAKASER
jgi:hypothetical protein